MTNRSPSVLTSAAAVAPRVRPQREFRLLRFFSMTSGFAILVMAVVLSWAHYQDELADQVALTESRNITLARTFTNTIRPEYDAFLLQEKASAGTAAIDPRVKRLDGTLARISRGIPLVKIVIYNINGRTIYSPERKDIGQDKSRNPLFRLARNGKAASEMTRRGERSKSDGELADFHLVSTYIPITDEDGRVAAVFELDSDITVAVARIEEANLRLLAGLIMLFACLYGVLLLIVGRADRILHGQYRELKRNEMQISNKNRELQVEIAARQEVELALRESEKAAATANQAKSQFLSSASHELRTPLNSILGFAQLLESEPSAPLAAVQRRFVDQILKAGRHLLALINEILDLSSIEAGKLRLSVEPVAVAVVVAECLPLIQAMAQRNGIAITAPSVLWEQRVLADHMRLKQSLLNLMSNAVKYNRPSGRVAVDVRLVAGQRIRISVEDTGIGIPESMHGDLFRPFHRLESSAKDVEGTGIGLALTQSLVTAMGGEIGVTSVVEQGSTFWIELPAAHHANDGATVKEISPAKQRAADIPAIGHCLLYVEDNPANVQVMEEIARRMSLRFLTAPDAESGILLATREQPDLIVMDIDLPRMNGYEALIRLRENPATAAIPVMALSAKAMDGDVMRGIAAGFVRYETKPYEVDDMIAKIRKLLSGGA